MGAQIIGLNGFTADSFLNNGLNEFGCAAIRSGDLRPPQQSAVLIITFLLGDADAGDLR